VSSTAEAEALLVRELQLIEEIGSTQLRPRNCTARAGLARLLGDDAGRERHLREAHRLYTEMGATGHAERLTRELRL
jgi:hypothetical protein